jgi:sugar-specific transcriptional regulator TrmB
MDEGEAVDAFEHLGLTSYEAKVFIALHRVGGGTAREVSQVTDVPRSQVYSAAESLADRGLVDVQQSNPIQYRPVSLDAARSTLRERLERERDRAFEYVESVRTESEDEQREDIWTIRGKDGIEDRVVELVDEADRRLVFGTGAVEMASDDVVAALESGAREGLAVVVVSENEAVRDRFEEDGVEVSEPPPALAGNERAGRFLFGDDDVLLMSVAQNDGSEMAVWSAHTSFANVLIRIVEVSLGVA